MTMRCAVIGAGWFGRAHCRVYREMVDAQLVAVADTDQTRSNEVARMYGCKPYGDFNEMLEKERPDAISVVVSPQSLANVASKVIEHGVAGLLIEKPVAASVQEVNDLANKSRRNKVSAMPGFIELFNPSIQRLEDAIKKNKEVGTPYVASSKRIGRNPKRGWDIGVLLDLGIHEIYVLRKLFGSPRRVFCQTKSFAGGKSEDVANILLGFDNGVLGMIETNWITPIGIRSMMVTGSDGSIEVDYMTQELKMIKKDQTVRPHFVFEEPLKREIKAFLDSLERNKEPPVTLEDAEQVVRVAFAALNSSKQMQVITL